jgi:hypothetical protein
VLVPGAAEAPVRGSEHGLGRGNLRHVYEFNR